MHFFVLLIVLCLTSTSGFAAEALSGDSIKLDDGRIAHLLGIKGASDHAQAALQSLIAGKNLNFDDKKHDRYERINADVYLVDTQTWLQGELLKTGNAFVYPPTGDEPRLKDLQLAENAARQAKQGIWAEDSYPDLPADQPTKIRYGQFAFVSGKVVQAERIKDKLYLNFGKDWHKDFTITIAARDLKLFRKAGIDPLKYEGQILRVRGWVKRDFGPMIAVTHPAQIEILGETATKP